MQGNGSMELKLHLALMAYPPEITRTQRSQSPPFHADRDEGASDDNYDDEFEN